MCTISYERCVCLLFLVILAVLSCSGFRIDNVAMTDIVSSRRNSQYRDLAPFAAAPRLRHQRHLETTPRTARNKRQCPDHDVAWKAYQADAVAVARAESKSANCRDNCTVQFRVLQWLKNRPPYEDRLLRLTFRADRANHCDVDKTPTRKHSRPRPRIDQNKEYVLFLKVSGPHNYSSVFVPEPKKKKTLNVVRKVNAKEFRPKPVEVLKIDQVEKRNKLLKLVCKVRGFPIPIIYWKRNSTRLQIEKRISITQKSEGTERKKSTLAISKFSEADFGVYECVAQGVDGKPSSKSRKLDRHHPPVAKGKPTTPTTTTNRTRTYPRIEERQPCPKELESTFCDNGGVCFQLPIIKEIACECAPGFKGAKCAEKDQPRS